MSRPDVQGVLFTSPLKPLLSEIPQVAQSIGLHRNGKSWNLSEEESLDRRRVFWELQALDVWQALGYGRPPSLVKPHFDCPQPFDTEESLGHPPNFHRWKVSGHLVLCSPMERG